MNTEVKKRVEWIDIARGIAIISMVYAHSDLTAESTSYIFAFHMPIFFILSGYLYRKPDDYKAFALKNVKKLLIPYAITCFFLLIVRICRYLIQPEYYGYCGKKLIVFRTIISSFVGFGCGPDESAPHFPFFEVWSVGPLWFLLTFLWAVLIFAVIMNITKDWHEIERGVLILALSMLGLSLSFYWIWLPLNLDIAVFALLFMYIGYVLKKYMSGNMHIITYILLLALYIVASMKYNSIGMSVRSVVSALTIPSAIAGSILVMELSKWGERALPSFIVKPIVWFGRNGMMIVCVHMLQFEIIPYVNIAEYLGIENYFVLMVNIINFVTIIIAVAIISCIKRTLIRK